MGDAKSRKKPHIAHGWVSPPCSLGSNQSHQQPKPIGGRVGGPCTPLRAAFVEVRRSGALFWGTLGHCALHSSFCAGGRHLFIWQPLDGAGTLHSSERPFCKCQRATLSGHRRLRHPVSPMEDRKAGDVQPGAVLSPPCALPAPPAMTLVSGEGGSNGKSMMTLESEVGWGPA